MQEKLMALWARTSQFAKENKETLIRVGGVVAGALIGAVVTTVITNAQNESALLENILQDEIEAAAE